MTDSSRALTIAKTLLKNHPKRLNHTLAVSDFALKLCRIYNVDPEKALVASYLHDATKYLPTEEAKTLIRTYYTDAFMNIWVLPTLHALSAASLAKKEGFGDEDIVNAILYHTTGRARMSTLEKIIFVADYCEETRWFDNQTVALVAQSDLDKAVLLILEDTLELLKKNAWDENPFTREAYEYYLTL